MTGLDTNVLARFLTDDDPVQARRAVACINTAAARGGKCYISPLVLCELAWVLRGAYDVSKADLIETIERLLSTTQFVIGDKDIVRTALRAYRTGRADFADYVIGHGNRESGCASTATFDRRLRGDSSFQLL